MEEGKASLNISTSRDPQKKLNINKSREIRIHNTSKRNSELKDLVKNRNKKMFKIQKNSVALLDKPRILNDEPKDNNLSQVYGQNNDSHLNKDNIWNRKMHLLMKQYDSEFKRIRHRLGTYNFFKSIQSSKLPVSLKSNGETPSIRVCLKSSEKSLHNNSSIQEHYLEDLQIRSRMRIHQVYGNGGGVHIERYLKDHSNNHSDTKANFSRRSQEIYQSLNKNPNKINRNAKSIQ